MESLVQSGADRADEVGNTPELLAFMLVLLPNVNSRKPKFEDHYPLIDPYYLCDSSFGCECPLNPSSRRWKVDCVLPGGYFDGRISGNKPLAIKRAPKSDELNWDNNLVRASELTATSSAYAVVTSDRLWHECVEPESQDLLVKCNGNWLDSPKPNGTLTPLQKVWRAEIAALLKRHGEGWVLGCTAHLASASTQTRDCKNDSAEWWSGG